jgi:flavin-binding protein dodecin
VARPEARSRRRIASVRTTGRNEMSVYRVTEVIGVSGDSWEDAARNAVETAAGTLRELRIAEVVRQDLTIEDGKVASYRVRLNLSFKYEPGD